MVTDLPRHHSTQTRQLNKSLQQNQNPRLTLTFLNRFLLSVSIYYISFYIYTQKVLLIISLSSAAPSVTVNLPTLRFFGAEGHSGALRFLFGVTLWRARARIGSSPTGVILCPRRLWKFFIHGFPSLKFFRGKLKHRFDSKYREYSLLWSFGMR